MIMDEALAQQWLSTVGYYRLSAYWYPARTIKDQIRSDYFKPGTHFNSATSLYESDRKLRTLIHDGMERIEVALRTKICDQLCHSDSLSYRDPSIFRPTFDHEQWMETARRRIERSLRHNEAIRHYNSEYDGNYPFWVMAEVLDFADMSKLYEGLYAKDQHDIDVSLSININLDILSKNQREKVTANSPMARWFEHFTIIRNMCAHHARLWNKSFTPAPTNGLRTIPPLQSLPRGQSEKIYGALIPMAYLLQKISPGTSWPHKVSALIRDSFLNNPLVSPQALGGPPHWDGSLLKSTPT